jgi:hypothetical protein
MNISKRIRGINLEVPIKVNGDPSAEKITPAGPDRRLNMTKINISSTDGVQDYLISLMEFAMFGPWIFYS